MSVLYRRSQLAIASVWLALATTAVHADVVSFVGRQGPKNLDLVPPPVLEASILEAQTNLSPTKVEVLGGNEFEGLNGAAPVRNFSYGTGASAGNASFTGGTIVPPPPDTSLGRYNMTAGVTDPNTGQPGIGHWLEATSDFEIDFTTAVSAFSFYVTDLGDYNGIFTIELYNGGTRVLVEELRNDLQRAGDGNGNLLYFGATSSTLGAGFTSARFLISQTNSTDVLGFDSFMVGNYRNPTTGGTIPEPTSLALVGLGLLAAGWSRKAQRTA